MGRKYRFNTWFNRSRPEEPPGENEEHEADKSPVNSKCLEVVHAFECYLEEERPIFEIRDTSELPFPKKDILDAVADEIRTSDDKDRVRYLKELALFLADFQDNVGSHPLTLMGMKDNEFLTFRHKVNDDFPDPMGMIERNPDKDKYRAFKKLCDREMAYIVNHVNSSGLLRKSGAVQIVG